MDKKGIALYHRVMRRENFEKAAKDIVGLLQNAQKSNPDAPRFLYVDIDGHRNEAGGYDSDMLELQKEFGVGFLLPFFTEVNFPLVSVTNPKEQNNDVPDGFEIFNAENVRDDSLNELYIENYSNTEFISETEVYNYLKGFSTFLKKYNEETKRFDTEDTESGWWLSMWYTHMKELIVELFNSFVHGNLISATAMTRTLIECYVYLSILIKEKASGLFAEWFLCSVMSSIRRMDENGREGIRTKIIEYCRSKDIDFEVKWNLYYEKSENSWMKKVLPGGKISFRAACDYLGEEGLYEDYQCTSSFVHGQDIRAKLIPFVFYDSIYSKLYIMMQYIFKSIRLFGVSEDTESQIQELELGLLELGERFCK